MIIQLSESFCNTLNRWYISKKQLVANIENWKINKLGFQLRRKIQKVYKRPETVRPKKIDPLFSVERPYIENMCAYSLFIGNMQHIVFFLYQNLQIDCIA